MQLSIRLLFQKLKSTAESKINKISRTWLMQSDRESCTAELSASSLFITELYVYLWQIVL